MKARLTILSIFLTGMIFMAGRASETPMKDLREAANEIDNIAERSENVQGNEEAFTILRDLNGAMKDVREATLTLDAKYTNMKVGGQEFQEAKQSEDFKNKMEEFNKINSNIDSSLATISENLEPYKKDEEVKKMLQKLQDLLISR